MAQSIAIRVSAGVSIAGGALFLLFAVVSFAAAFLAPSPQTASPVPYRAVMGGAAMSLGALAVWGLATGVAIFRRKRWARVSILIFAGFVVFVSGSSVLAMLTMPAQPAGHPGITPALRWLIAGIYAALGAVGVCWLFLFSGRGARDYFGNGGEPRDNARPLSISIIAWCLLIAGISMGLSAVARVPAVLFGLVFTGIVAAAVYVLYATLNVGLGAALLGMRESARLGGIAYFCFLAANSIYSWVRLGRAGVERMVGEGMPAFVPAGTPVALPPMWFVLLLTAASTAIPIYFLIRRRGAFTQP